MNQPRCVKERILIQGPALTLPLLSPLFEHSENIYLEVSRDVFVVNISFSAIS